MWLSLYGTQSCTKGGTNRGGLNSLRGIYVQYLYIFTTGVGIAYWSFGYECLCHGFACIVINNLVLKFGPNGTKSRRFYTAALLVLFQLSYLLVGYLNRQKWGEYDAAIDWTTPHCVLSLRLMAITMDFYDGNSRYILI